MPLDPRRDEVGGIARAVRGGRTSAAEVVEEFLGRIEKRDGAQNAFLTLAGDRAHAAAERIDTIVREGGDPGSLAGVPIAVKDNLSTRNLRTTCGSRILDTFLPVFDATAVRRLEEEGAIVIGKTNLDEFGMGASTEFSAFGPTSNPWSADHVPGGSSGGSAAAVASGMAPAALGTDTGGSVRQPASFCNLVGLKPTYGAVSRYGLIAFASSLDCVGPLARSASDCALLFNAISGKDPRDATSLTPRGRSRPVPADGPLSEIRFGLPSNWLGSASGDVVRVADRAASMFRRAGAACEVVDLPDPEDLVAVYAVIATAEASSNLARYDGVRYGRRTRGRDALEMIARTRGDHLGAEVKRRIALGTFALSRSRREAYYHRAQRARLGIRERLTAVLERCDAVLLPTAPTAPFRLGERCEDPIAMLLSDLFTIPASLAGVPAVSFPAGFSSGGLPIGMQLIGRSGEEDRLLCLVARFEELNAERGA